MFETTTSHSSVERDVMAERFEIARAVERRTLPGELARTVRRYGDRDALKWPSRSGWQTLTWREYRDRLRDFSLGLRALGFGSGQFAVLLTGNRPEHVIAAQGVVHAEGTPVALYDAAAPAQIGYIANHCEATVAIVEDRLLDAFLGIRDGLPALRHVVVVGGKAPDGTIGWDDVLESGRAENARDPLSFERAARMVAPDDLAAVIYTSGTTGPPKGVMLTHRFALCWVESWTRVSGCGPGERVVSYLPLAHCTSQWLTQWQSTVHATVTYFCPDPAQLVATLREARPTLFLGVPRVWEKLRAGLTAAGVSSGGLEEIGLDRCRVPVICAAPCPPDLLDFFHALGLALSDGWGMTELGFGTWNGLEHIKPGTIGPAMPGVEARVAGDGELIVRGVQMMDGYYKDPVRTAEAIDADGSLHTGDVVEVDADGYYRIVDRKKDLIITTGGKNISPSNLEAMLKEHALIGQACAIGDNRDHIAALLVLEPALAASSDAPLAEVARHLESVNARLSGAEQIRAFTILPGEWTVEGEELTPTLKIRRARIEEKYAREIEAIYAGGDR